MRLVVGDGDSSEVVWASIDNVHATIRDLAEALALGDVDVLAIDGVPYDYRVPLEEVGLVSGSRVSKVEEASLDREDGRFWIGVVNGPSTGLLVAANGGSTVAIGRAEENDLSIDNTTISQQHALVHVTRGGEVELEDLGSLNGTWLDGRSVVGRVPVQAGQLVRVGSSTLIIRECDPVERIVGMSAQHGDSSGRVLLNRPPRPPTPTAVHDLELPDAVEFRSNPALALVSLVAPLIFAGVMVATLGSWRYAIFGLLSPVMAVGNWLSGRRRVSRERRNDGRLHADALARLEGDLDAAERVERTRRSAFGPDMLELRRRIFLPTRQLWERRLTAADALTVRLGIGESPWTLRTDSAAESAEVRDILETAETLSAIEVLVDFRDGPVGLVGERGVTAAAARSLTLQLATHHGPADVRLAVFTTAARVDDWSWVQWLPHCTGGDGSTYLFVGEDSVEFASSLGKSARPPGGEDNGVLWVLVVDDIELLHSRSSPVRSVLAGSSAVVGLVIAESDVALPASVANVVRVDDQDGMFSLRRPAAPGSGSCGVADLVSASVAGEVARSMARFEDPESENAGELLPSMVRGESLFGEALTVDMIRSRWSRSASDRELKTPIGVSANGRFDIDLVADGPHVLVAGTTGSGKSEFLRTFVVGLAANYDPSRIVFVLIDYKGGSAFDRCAELAHVVGVVTDLDDHLAERALQSLEAELRFREERFRLVGAEDIAAYQTGGQNRPPIPSLIVVIDEFATLRRELPGFVDSLVAIAQRGRSLGVHLVLATQRPSGSVDANIRANTNLRVALRVQSGGDSIDVIDSDLAADISRACPGRAYVRRGEGDLAAVQTGFVSGPTKRSGPLVGVRRPFFGLGQSPKTPPTDAGLPNSPSGASELEVLVESLAEAARDLPIPRRPWLDDLPALVLPEQLDGVTEVDSEDGSIAVVLGDDPDNQRRVIRRWGPHNGHLAAMGVRGSGVTTAIRSAIAALGEGEADTDRWVFAVDHAGGGLSGVEAWPHVSCCLDPTERERHLRLLSFLEAELDLRRSLPSSECRALPLVVLAVDGIAAFMDWLESEAGPGKVDLMTRLGRDGVALGIVLIVGATRPGDVPRVLRGQLRRQLLFEQADDNDYASAGVRPKTLPKFVPGRAILSDDGMVCQVIDWETGFRSNVVSPGVGPPVIEVLPARIDATALSVASIEPALHIPIGMLDATRAAAVLRLRRGEHATVAGPAGSGRTSALRLIAAQLRAASPDAVLVVVAPDEASSLRDSTLFDAGGSLHEIEHVLAMAVDDDRRWVIFVDDADRVDVDRGPLVDLAASAPSHVTIIVAIRSSVGRTVYGHWTRSIRASGIGVLLMPDVSVDGELLAARLPRADRPRQVPGRGYLVGAGNVEVVQLAI